MNNKRSLYAAGKKITATLAGRQNLSLPVGNYHLKIPSLWIRGHYFYCDGEALSFRHAERKLSLLKAFLSAASYRLKREQVIDHVYCEGRWHRHSNRFIDCLNMNMLRTISDTRRQLYISFAHLYPGINWLSFSRETKDWKLLHFKEDYVLAQLHAIIY